MNKHQVNGRMRAASGKVKETAGKALGNKTMEAKGKVQKHVGKAEAKYGDKRHDYRMDQRKDPV